MMREKHLSAEEIMKYMDTSDLSEEYLLWMEKTSEHLMTCHSCYQKMRQAMLVESICEEGGLEIGLRLLAREEKIIGEIDKKPELDRERKTDEDRSEI